MKRSRKGWPPNSHRYAADRRAREIASAIADSTRSATPRTYGSRTVAELRNLIPIPYRPALLSSERATLATTLRKSGQGVLALNVIHLMDQLDTLRAALPDLIAAAEPPTKRDQ